MARDWALFLHLSGVLLFVGGSIAVTALRLLAIGRNGPRRARSSSGRSGRSSRSSASGSC